VTRDLDTTFKV